MNTRIDDPAAFLGAKIESVSSAVTTVHPDTGQESLRFLVQLSNGMSIDLLPGDLVRCKKLPAKRNPAKLQIIDGVPTVDGDLVVGVLSRITVPPANLSRDVDLSVFRQVALVLSSGRAMVNLPRCGGSNVLHVESMDGFKQRFGSDWHDRWPM
jgi:hypothetical protein